MTMPTAIPVSVPTQQLIDLCNAVAAGDFDRLDDLRSMADSRRADLTSAWEEFAKELEAKDEAFTQANQAVIEAVEAQFLAYSQRLDDISRWQWGEAAAGLTDAAAELAQVSPALLTAQAALEAAELTQGPSRFPTVNLFDNMAKRLRAGQLLPERWSGACYAHREFYGAARDEIDASAHATEPNVPERRAALQSLVELFERMQGMDASTSPHEFDDALEAMTSTHIELTAAIDAYNYHHLAETPTASPEANRVIHAAQGLASGVFPLEILHGLAEEMQKRVRQGLQQMDTITTMTPESAVVAEEVPRMLEALEAMDDALAALLKAEGPGEAVDQAVSALQGAVGRFDEANKHVTRNNETHGKAMCPSCQAVNDRSSRVCMACQRPLPRFVSDDVQRDVELAQGGFVEGGAAGGSRQSVTTGPMRELQAACEAFERDRIGQDEFLAVVDAAEQKVRRAEAKLTQLSLPAVPPEATPQERTAAQEFIDLGADALQLLGEGVQQCLSGLASLRAFAEQHDPASMREGLREFGYGTQKMLQIEKVAETFVAALPPIPDSPQAERPATTEAGAASWNGHVPSEDDEDERTFGSV